MFHTYTKLKLDAVLHKWGLISGFRKMYACFVHIHGINLSILFDTV